MNILPFVSVADISLDTNNNMRNCMEDNSHDKTTSNNDFLLNIDPDHNITRDGLTKQCRNYDTSSDFNNICGTLNNISMLHANICSSAKKITDFKYYLDNLKLNFSFIGFSETWATLSNKDTLNIPGYRHEQCIRSNKKKGGGTSLYIHNTIQYKIRKDLTLDKKQFESIFIEVDKAIFKTNRNVVIGELYRPPSSKIKNFDIEFGKLLNKIKKGTNMPF